MEMPGVPIPFFKPVYYTGRGEVREPQPRGIKGMPPRSRTMSSPAASRSGDLELMCPWPGPSPSMAVLHQGWMVRYGRRKIGTSFFHDRYFVLDNKLLAYYKRQPRDKTPPLKSLVVDENCIVEDRGRQTHQGQMVYALCVYNKKQKDNSITMGARNIKDVQVWKKKIELLIDQQQDSVTDKSRKTLSSLDFDMDSGGPLSSSDPDDSGPDDEEEEEEEPRPKLLTVGKGLPDSVHDRTKESRIGVSNKNDTNQADSRKKWRDTNQVDSRKKWCDINQADSRKKWRLLRCQNGLRIFEELLEAEYLAKSCSRSMRAVGVVKATCEAIFGLIMSMDATRHEWDSSFQSGSLVEQVDGHTAILYHRLQLNWCSMVLWPRDLCYVRDWRRNDDGSYVVMFRSTEHQRCGPQPGFVRASIESGGFKITPLEPVNGRPRAQVQHLMQIDLKGWGVNYVTLFHYHYVLQMLNCIAGLREYFSQNDDVHTVLRSPVMNTTANVAPVKKDQKHKKVDSKTQQVDSDNENSAMIDDDSDEDDNDNQVPEASLEVEEDDVDGDEECSVGDADPIDLSCFSGIMHRDADENSRNSWSVPDSNIFKVRSKNYLRDKSKVPSGKYLMELVAADWFKDTKRMDHVARRKGCVAQVAAEKGMFTFVLNMQFPGSTHHSLVLYFVTKSLKKGSLLQRFADGDDDFRNSRLKLIPSIPKGSWIVRQSVGSTPCLLGKAVECRYFRGPEYIEVDVDNGSSAIANRCLGLVLGVLTSLVFDVAILIQANTYDELPEQLIGAGRFSHVETSAAVVPVLDDTSSAGD